MADTNPTPASPLVGTWNATSWTNSTGDQIANGMGFNAVIAQNGTVTLNMTGDLTGLCNPGPNCTRTGTWTSNGSTLTISSDPDVLSLNWSMNNDQNQMTWTGNLGGEATTIVFNKQ